MTTRIDKRFATLKQEGRAALVTFTMAGDPDYATSLAIAKALPEAGADVIELGVPFSDPIADGPVIQQSSQEALANGMTLNGALDLVRDAGLEIPVVLFTYLNPLLSGGADILSDARDAGIDGVGPGLVNSGVRRGDDGRHRGDQPEKDPSSRDEDEQQQGG